MSKFMDSHLRSAHSAAPGGCRHEGSHWPFRVTLAGGYSVTPLLQVGKQAGESAHHPALHGTQVPSPVSGLQVQHLSTTGQLSQDSLFFPALHTHSTLSFRKIS